MKKPWPRKSLAEVDRAVAVGVEGVEARAELVVRVVAELAVAHVNADPTLLPRHTLALRWRDSGCSAPSVPTATTSSCAPGVAAHKRRYLERFRS